MSSPPALLPMHPSSERQLDTLQRAETPEGITIALRPAGVVARFYAALIDAVLKAGLVAIASIVFNQFGRMGLGALLIVAFVVEWFYPVLFELSASGATPGKKSLGLTVVMDTGLPITPAASVLRNVLRSVDFLPFLYAFGLIAMLCRPDFKRLGDLAASSLVVHARDVALHGAVPAAEPVAPARPLSTVQQVALTTWAGRFHKLTPERLDELALLAKGLGLEHRVQPRLALLSIVNRLLGRQTGQAPRS
jgi:uncharacterized RDD family membrane protein YckC